MPVYIRDDAYDKNQAKRDKKKREMEKKKTEAKERRERNKRIKRRKKLGTEYKGGETEFREGIDNDWRAEASRIKIVTPPKGHVWDGETWVKDKKEEGGKLNGPSHDKGGIPIEAEGGEYVIKKDSVNKETEPILEEINKTGKLPSQSYDEWPVFDSRQRKGDE